MRFFPFLTISLVISNYCYGAKNCDKRGINVYEDMKCKTTAVDCHNCPTQYDCSNIQNDTNHCYFKGTVYKPDDENIQSEESHCDVACLCMKDVYPASIMCAIVDCAEDFGIPPTPGCYRTYDLRSCCSIGENCPKNGSKPFECVVDGQVYKEGQRFFPISSCSICICQKGFKGKYEAPFCVPRRCNVEINNPLEIQQSCAPVYLNRVDLQHDILCCPSGWICPTGKEIISGNPKSDDICKFGDKHLKLGQHIETIADWIGDPQPVICKCHTPPLLTCLKEENVNILN